MTVQELIADPSNAGQVDAWDGKEGVFWTAQAQRFDETLASSHSPFLDAAAIRTAGDDFAVAPAEPEETHARW